jgi:phage terminase large subunit-like protein
MLVNGKISAQPHSAPWVQTVAVSLEQTKNTMRVFPGLFGEDYAKSNGITVQKIQVEAPPIKLIQAVTSSPGTIEGGRPTFILANETQNWNSSNAGHDMYEAIDGNVAKSRDASARVLQICNAHVPGRDSVAERAWDAYQKVQEGSARDAGMLYDSLEAPYDVDIADPEQLAAAIRIARGDAVWLSVDRYVAKIYDVRTPLSESRRKFLNQIQAPEDALVTPDEWRALAVKEALKPGDSIVMGFDGGKTDDATALVAIRMKDRLAVPLGIWEQPPGPAGEGWEVDQQRVSDVVGNAFGTYHVVGFFADVANWQSYIDFWARQYGETLLVKASPKHKIARDMRGGLRELTYANERLLATIQTGDMKHNGDPTLRRHVLNARRWPNNFGLSFGKEHRESSKKVDGYSALMLADMAYNAVVDSGKSYDADTSVYVLC